MMIIETNNKNPLTAFLGRFSDSPASKTADLFKVDSKRDYTSPVLPKSKAIPKAPSFFIVYRFAPGFHNTSVSVELNQPFKFLNQFA